MKKFLKKQGKKVSVILLATALMISPMLPIVKAASGCEKKQNIYMFSYADVMETEHVDYNDYKTLKLDVIKEKGYTDWSTQATEEEKEAFNAKVKIEFTDKYVSLYGWNADSLSGYESQGYDRKNINVAGHIVSDSNWSGEGFHNDLDSFTQNSGSYYIPELENWTDFKFDIPVNAVA